MDLRLVTEGKIVYLIVFGEGCKKIDLKQEVWNHARIGKYWFDISKEKMKSHFWNGGRSEGVGCTLIKLWLLPSGI